MWDNIYTEDGRRFFGSKLVDGEWVQSEMSPRDVEEYLAAIPSAHKPVDEEHNYGTDPTWPGKGGNG